MGIFFNRWSLEKAEEEIRELPNVYDVLSESTVKDQYLMHVWLVELSEGIKQTVTESLRQLLGKRPRHVKIDVILYRKADSV